MRDTPHVPAQVLEACVVYAHTYLFADSDARLFWAISEALVESLRFDDRSLRWHLREARDLVVRRLVSQGKVEWVQVTRRATRNT